MQWLPAATLLGPMGATLCVSYVFNQAARRIAPAIGWVDKPDGGRKTHQKPTPVMGGVAFVSAILAVVAVSAWFRADWLMTQAVRHLALSLGASAVCFCVLGVIDDRWPLTPRVKLLGQILSSLPFVHLNGSVQQFGFLGWVLPLGPLGGLITVLWLVACSNVVNLIDGLDGLAGSIGVVVLTTIAALFTLADRQEEAILTAVISGGIVGFLCHNWPPAKIFMGDAGSMTIGFLAGALSIQASSKTATTFTLAVPIVLMSIPMFDTTMAILRRKLTGRKIGEGDRGHIHHRLQDRGLSRQQALLAIAGLAMVMAGAVLISALLESEAYALGICGGVLVLLILGRVFGYHETSLIFRHLKELGDVLAETSGVLQTRLLMARLDNLDVQQRTQLWDHLVAHASHIKATRLDFYCRSLADDRITTQLSWENRDVEPEALGPSWQVAYHVPRGEWLMATLEAHGHAADGDTVPRMDDLLRLFVKVSLQLPTHDPLPVREEEPTLRFPVPRVPEPVRHAA